MNPILDLLIRQAPELIGLIGDLVRKHQPDAPVPTDAEIIAAFEQLFRDSSAQDALLIAALRREIEG